MHRADDEVLMRAMVTLASHDGRYGYRRMTVLLRRAGWTVGKDRVARIWRREGLQVPLRQKPRGRRWRNDGSCMRLRPERMNHVWSYDFVSTRTHDGRPVRVLTLIDEYTRACLALRVARRLGSLDVIDTVADVMGTRGIPAHLRSDNGPAFIAAWVRQWLAAVGGQTLEIEPGSPWKHGYCESFNSKLRDECLNGEICSSLQEAQILIERGRVHDNTVRPHSSLGDRPPAPMAYRLAMPPPSASRSPVSPVMETLIPTDTKHRAGHCLGSASLRRCFRHRNGLIGNTRRLCWRRNALLTRRSEFRYTAGLVAALTLIGAWSAGRSIPKGGPGHP